MSQSLLYHAFGIKNVIYRSTEYIGNMQVFFMLGKIVAIINVLSVDRENVYFVDERTDGYKCRQLEENRRY